MTETGRFPDWEEKYKTESVESMGWFYEELDPDLAQAIQKLSITSGKALDLGTGPGTQAVGLSKLGFVVTGTDLSQSAIEKARVKAGNGARNISFFQDDILQSRLVENFDFVFDRGCFHVFSPEKRPEYLRQIKKLVKKDGFLFLKCFSAREPSEKGPYKFTEEEIEKYFSPDFNIVSIKETVYYGTVTPLPKALFCTLKKL